MLGDRRNFRGERLRSTTGRLIEVPEELNIIIETRVYPTYFPSVQPYLKVISKYPESAR